MSPTHRSPNQDTSRRNLTGPLRKARAAKHARLRPRQLRCEPLEDRRLLSVFTSIDPPKAIPDKGTLTSTIPVSDTYYTADVNVTVNMTHTRDEDLDVFLVAPDGTRVELFTDVGGTGDHFTTTILDDSATTSITTGKAPFIGTFRPEGNLSLVEGKPVHGTWKLEVTDDTKKETGTLKSWSLTVTEATGVSTSFLDTNPAMLGNVATSCNDVVVSENGDAMAMWLESKGTGNTGPLMVMAARYDAVAGTWGTPAIISNSSSTDSVQGWSRIASDGQGNYLVAWQQQLTPTGYSSIWANRYVAGTGWQTPQVIGTGSTWSYNPEVAMARDQTGTKAVVVWSYENKLYDRRLVDFANGTWSSPEIAGSGGSSYSVVIGPDGDFLTVSVAQDATSNNLFYRNYDWQTGLANTESLMVTSSEVIFVPPGAMKMNASGVAMVIWLQYTGEGAALEVWGRRWNGSGWGSSQPELIVASLSPAGYGSSPDGPALSVSDNGEAAVTWHQRRDGSTFTNAYVRRHDGTAWQPIEKVDSEDLGDVGAGSVSGNSMGPAGIAMDDLGNITAVWQQSDGLFTNIWSAKFDHSVSGGVGAWSPAAKIEQAPWDAIQPVVAMNSSGVTTTIWVQPDNTLTHIYASRTTPALSAPVATLAALSGNDTALASMYDEPLKKVRVDTVRRSESRVVESHTRDLSYTVGASANRSTDNSRWASDNHHQAEVDDLFAEWDSDPLELLSLSDLGM